MSAQNFFLAGVDLSAISTVQQSDIMQAINQISLLDNIGVTIASTTRPDITNNPSMIRCLWLDISNPSSPVLKKYIGDRTTLQDADIYWIAQGVDNGAILTAMIAARSASGGVNVGLIKLNSDYSASPGSAFYILRVDATGKFIEAISLDQELLDGGGVALNRLSTTGLAAGKFIGFSAGVAGYVPIVPATDLIGTSRVALETNVVPSTARYVARTNAAGTAGEWVTPVGLFNDSELTLVKLDGTGGSAYYCLRRNSTNTGNEWAVNPLARQSGALTSGALSNGGLLTIPHGLGVAPKVVQLFVVNNTGGAFANWANGEEIPNCGVVGSDNFTLLTWYADATNVYIRVRNLANLQVMDKTTGAFSANNAVGNWFARIYAFSAS